MREVLTKEQIQERLTKVFPGIKLRELFDYDDRYYLVIATEKEGVDYNCPYYLVDKYEGAVHAFNPLDDLDKFDDALEKPIPI